MNTVNCFLISLASVSLLSILAGLWSVYTGVRKKEDQGPLEEFLLSNHGLSSQNVVQLLLSSSFSLNGMLYQIWLGYQIGIWALLFQAAWATSYVLLSTRFDEVRALSMHDFIGQKYGVLTRRIAGMFSIAGFLVLIGWEFNVGQTTLSMLSNEIADPINSNTSFMLMLCTIAGSFIYTAIGGLKGNAFANLFQNLLKLFVFISLIFLLTNSSASSWATLFPSFSVVLDKIGVFGLITNLVLSLLWQFVDMSTWHSVIASRSNLSSAQQKKALCLGAVAVFFAPGIVGTMIGALLVNTPDINPDNILARAIGITPNLSWFVLLGAFSAIIATVMSVVDGYMLSAAYSLVCDVLFPKQRVKELDSVRLTSAKILLVLRCFLALIVFGGAVGVWILTNRLDISLFDILYVLIVCQLSLTGCVMMSLFGGSRLKKTSLMYLSIFLGAIIGFGFVAAGKLLSVDWMLQGAGTFAAISSYIAASVIDKSSSSTESM